MRGKNFSTLNPIPPLILTIDVCHKFQYPTEYRQIEKYEDDTSDIQEYSVVNQTKLGGNGMNLERVIFGFFVILALTLNVIFVMGDFDNIDHHNVWILTLAILVSLCTTGLKLGDRSQIGALLLAASLVADLLLIAARIVWVVAESESAAGPAPETIAMIVSIAAGAVLANIISCIIVIGDTLMSRR